MSESDLTLTPPKAAECRNHPDRQTYARGFCNSCYRKWRDLHKIERATCHPDRPHRAKGLCKNCYKAALDKRLPKERMQRRWRKAALKYNFGLSEKDYEGMLEAQDHKCGICCLPLKNIHGKGKRPHVDHDHCKGYVRGILCAQCNTRLAFVESHGDRALGYLDKHRARHSDSSPVWWEKAQ